MPTDYKKCPTIELENTLAYLKLNTVIFPGHFRNCVLQHKHKYKGRGDTQSSWVS